MNILMLGWELPPYNSGGLGVACYHLARALAEQGAKIDFVLPYSASHPDTDFMKIHAGSSRQADTMVVDGSEAYAGRSVDESASIRSLQKDYRRYVERLVRRQAPSVIHAHDWLTLEAGMRAKELCGAPLIAHVHATEFDRAGGPGNPLIHEIERQGLMMADRVIAVSAITKALIIHKYKIPADKIEVIHNAIDAENLERYSYDQSEYRYLEQLKQEGYTVVTSLARLTIQKGLGYLVRAFAAASQKYPKLVLLLAGDGEDRNELIELAAEYGVADRVLFSGFVRGKQWRDAYTIADTFILSSISEPFGLTALEAAHYDTALIITNQSGVSEVIHSSLRYDFWDEKRLADQIVAIAASPALKRELKRGAMDEYAQLNWRDIARRCQTIYRRQAVAATFLGEGALA